MGFIYQAISLLRPIGDIAVIGLAIASALAFIPHTFVNEWIRTRFAKEVEREGRVHQAQLQTDLEDYKDRLLQQLDERRLSIDLRRSIALQASAAKLEFIRKISVSVAEFSSFAASIPTLQLNHRAGCDEGLLNRRRELMTLRLEADIYLDLDVSANILDLLIRAGQLADAALRNNTVLALSDPKIADINQRAAQIGNSLRAAFQALVESGHVTA